MIKESGKSGIKALSLASKLKKDGKIPPSKVELLESGVKSKGKGGGTHLLRRMTAFAIEVEAPAVLLSARE